MDANNKQGLSIRGRPRKSYKKDRIIATIVEEEVKEKFAALCDEKRVSMSHEARLAIIAHLKKYKK